MKYLFSSESVSDGHPDKICDLISDRILDEILKSNLSAKVAVEASLKDDLIFIFGETSYNGSINYSKIAKNVLKEIGLPQKYQTLTMVETPNQNENIIYDNLNKEQAIIFGYATNETNTFMPLPIYIAHKLTNSLKELRNKTSYIMASCKSLVTVEYENNKPRRVKSIVLSVTHQDKITTKALKKLLLNEVIIPNVSSEYIDEETRIIINLNVSDLSNTYTDKGATGRKNISDTYGGILRTSSGFISGKDPSNIERTAAYYSRYVAKNVVAHGLAERCEIQVVYQVGDDKPSTLTIDTFKTEKCPINQIYDYVNKNFSFDIHDMIKELELYKVKFSETTNFGHFGKEGFPWENIKE